MTKYIEAAPFKAELTFKNKAEYNAVFSGHPWSTPDGTHVNPDQIVSITTEWIGEDDGFDLHVATLTDGAKVWLRDLGDTCEPRPTPAYVSAPPGLSITHVFFYGNYEGVQVYTYPVIAYIFNNNDDVGFTVVAADGKHHHEMTDSRSYSENTDSVAILHSGDRVMALQASKYSLPMFVQLAPQLAEAKSAMGAHLAARNEAKKNKAAA